MTSFVVKNNAESTVADNPLAQAATTLNVAAGGGGEFPSTFPFLITLWDESTYPDPTDDSGMEIVKCTGRSTDALTIVRAQEGTADVAHSLGERVAMLITAGILNDATYGLATKLDTIETSATADQTGAEIKTAYETVLDAYTDTKNTKLAGIATAATKYPDTGEQAFLDADHTKLDGIEASADVTDATNVNAAGAVMESDIKDQSFTNLLENGDFESWSAGTAVAPDGWVIGGIGAAIAQSVDKKIGNYSCQITSGTGDAYPNQTLDELDYYKVRILTFGCWVKASDISTARIYIYDGISSTYSSYHTGSGAWEWLTVTLTIDASATTVSTRLRVVSASKIAYFDGAILVEGSVCPAFSPKPMPNSSLITSAPIDTGYDGEVRIYSTGGTRRIYISDGTDWKYVSVAT